MGLFKILKTGYEIYKTVKPVIQVANEGMKIVNSTMEINNTIHKQINKTIIDDNLREMIERHFYKYKNQMPDDIKKKFENRIFNENLIEVETTKNIAKTIGGNLL